MILFVFSSEEPLRFLGSCRWKMFLVPCPLVDPVDLKGTPASFFFFLTLLTRKGRHNSFAFAGSKPMLSASGFLRACLQIFSRAPLSAIACQQLSTRMPPSRDFADASLRDRLSADLFARASVPKVPSSSAAQRRCCPPSQLPTRNHQSQKKLPHSFHQ